MTDTTPERSADSSTREGQVVFLSLSGTDAELVAALVQGDRRAMGALVDRYGRYVEGVVARLTGCDSQFRDFVQEVFARAIVDIGKLRDPERLKPWLRSIAVHTVRSELRRRSRWSFFMYRDPATLPEPAAPVTDDMETDRIESVRRILDRMPTEERMILSLRYFEELEQLEISRELGISLATVKRRLGHATDRFLTLASRDAGLLSWMGNRKDDAS